MRAELVLFGEAFVRNGIHGADGARFVVAVAGVHALIGSVVAQIVDVTVKINTLDKAERSSVIDIKLAVAAGGKKLLGFRRVHDTLRIWYSRNGVAAQAGTDVDNLYGVVSKSRDDQTVFAIETEMVEASLHAGHRDCFG